MQKILIIDDEKAVVDMLSDFLGTQGYAVSKAYDGEEGIRKFDSDKPDIVMCDIRMPRKDGFAFLEEIRSSRSWVPVIMVSAISDPVSIMKGYAFEADYYITKPINLEDTLKTLKIMLSLAPLRKK
ncbi:MAG: response regulator [Candidatus Omnitrophica bacterium]|nr:response regulator [Candidatus Omnitrophota bacterium]